MFRGRTNGEATSVPSSMLSSRASDGCWHRTAIVSNIRCVGLGMAEIIATVLHSRVVFVGFCGVLVWRRWWPQRDSNPCFSLERAVSWASRRWGRPSATSRAVGVTSATEPYTKFVGWGRRIRTPATWSRATRPTTRRSPTNAPNLTIPPNEGPPGARLERARRAIGARPEEADSANRRFESAARAEARHLRGRNLNLLAGAWVAAVAGGAARDHKSAESGDCDAAAAAERFDDAADEGVHGALGGDLRASRSLRHDCYDLGLGHRESRLLY